MSERILIRDGAVLTAHGWVQPGYVEVAGEVVTALGQGTPPETLVTQASTLVDARHCAVLPGLINGHTHFSQTFMRGLAGGRPLLPWLRELIWPLQRALTSEDLRLAALLGLVENLRGGVTHVVDHHKVASSTAHTDAVCEAAERVGLRLTLARGWTDQGKNAEAPKAILTDLERLFETWSGHDRLRIASGPLALWRCSAETLRRTHALARRYDSVTHVHVAETEDEIQMSLDAHGLRPVAWLAEIDVLDAHTQVVHAVWVDDDEIALLTQRDAMVVHCPVSNAVLGSGVAPVAALHAQDVRLRLGTDGPASNDTQDLFETLKAAISFARATTCDPTVLPPHVALRLATGGQTLATGASADVIVVNLDHPRAVPVHDVDSALTLSTHGSDVKTVIVSGELLMHEGRVLVLDERALLAACREAVTRLRFQLEAQS